MLNEEQTIQKANCKLQQRILSPINPDCIKVNPLDQNLFAFAYYQQHPSFVGGIAVYNHQKMKSVSKIQISEYGPVMHICWLAQKHKDGRYILCGVSRSQKCFIALYDSQDNKIQIVKDIFLEQEGAGQIFCLYIDAQIVNDKLRLFVSSNQSKVYQLTLSREKFTQIERFVYNKHQYAVWACRANKNHMACGDEVNKLYLYQIEQQKLLSTNSKIHQQGICDIVFLNDNVFYSGGFDGNVGLIDLRSFATEKTKWNYGGTIWRILPSQQSNQKLLLCNSSEKKFMIVDIRANKVLWNSENSHQSLAYAADWNKNTLLTASFYDKVVCRWNMN